MIAPGEKMGGKTHGVGWGERNYHPGEKSTTRGDRLYECHTVTISIILTYFLIFFWKVKSVVTIQIMVTPICTFLSIWQENIMSTKKS